jgi:cell division protein FtsW
VSAPSNRPAPHARYLLLAATLVLAFGGLLMIYSASFATDFIQFHDSYYHVAHQAVFLALGLVVLLVCSRMPVSFVRKLGWWVLGTADVLLLFVFVRGVGKYGATRWIDLGFTTLQPSEFAKLGCVLVVAGIMADRIQHPGPLKDDLLKGALAVGIPFVLVMIQPDMGTAMSILIAVFLVVVLGGLPWRYIVGSFAAIAAAVPLLVFAKSYRASRLLSFMNPSSDPQGAGYQILQAKLAFGSGGVFGLGLGMSRQKYMYLPAANTDFIFAIIGEELGLLGTTAVIVAFGVLCYAGIRLALSVKDPYGRLVAGGLTTMIVVQALINMASVTGLMPVTGIPLPFVSYGGSSLIFTLGCVGLILAMAREPVRAASSPRPHVSNNDKEGSPGARSGERRRNGGPRLSSIGGGRARLDRSA